MKIKYTEERQNKNIRVNHRQYKISLKISRYPTHLCIDYYISYKNITCMSTYVIIAYYESLKDIEDALTNHIKNNIINTITKECRI